MQNYSKGKPTRFRGLWLLFIFQLFFCVTYAQTITGTVTDEKGTKLSRVSVIIKGSSQGTTTDNSGKFSLHAAGNATLVFSSVGFKTMEVGIEGRTEINISLASDNQGL